MAWHFVSMVFVLLSPAKTMAFTHPRPHLIGAAPHFQKQAIQIMQELRALSQAKLGRLLDVSEKLAALNHARNQSFAAKPKADNHDAAILAYQGDTYIGFDAATADDKTLQWAHDHIGILSGLYGLVQPLDAIQAYRLEMGTKLKIEMHADLYDFWGDAITKRINALVKKNGLKAVIGCASNEYLSAVDTAALSVPFIQCDFKEVKNGKAQTIGLFAKRARGMMARYVADKRVTKPADLKKFSIGGYRFDANTSTETSFVFIR